MGMGLGLGLGFGLGLALRERAALYGRGGGEGVREGGHLVENAAQGPHVDLVVLRLLREHLRSEVAQRGAGQPREADVALQLRDAQVRELTPGKVV